MNHSKQRTLIFLGVAIAVALITSYFVFVFSPVLTPLKWTKLVPKDLVQIENSSNPCLILASDVGLNNPAPALWFGYEFDGKQPNYQFRRFIRKRNIQLFYFDYGDNRANFEDESEIMNWLSRHSNGENLPPDSIAFSQLTLVDHGHFYVLSPWMSDHELMDSILKHVESR